MVSKQIQSPNCSMNSVGPNTTPNHSQPSEDPPVHVARAQKADNTNISKDPLFPNHYYMAEFSGLRCQLEAGQGEESTPRVLTILSSVLERLVARNDQLAEECSASWQGRRLSGFHGVRAPSISIAKYLERLYKYSSCSPSCFVVAYVYIDRLLHKFPDSLLVSLNVHRLLVTTIMLASKMLDDAHYNNAFYARIGGVSNTELNRLELELLFLLDFGLTVSSRVFEIYCSHLEKDTSMVNGGSSQRVDRPLTPNGGVDATQIPVDDTTLIS